MSRSSPAGGLVSCFFLVYDGNVALVLDVSVSGEDRYPVVVSCHVP